MVQAARSGRQNIAEGCQAGTTSTEKEIKLLNVAKASLHELMLDYEDYLRVRELALWNSDPEKAQALTDVHFIVKTVKTQHSLMRLLS